MVDNEPKYGLCVTGRVHPDRVMIKGGLRPGDRLFLSKPLGTGVITTAAKGDATDAATLQGAVTSMLRLNRRAAEVATGQRTFETDTLETIDESRTDSSSNFTSRADCHRSSGSLARQIFTTRSRACGVSGWVAEMDGGCGCMIAPITLAWLFPRRPFDP